MYSLVHAFVQLVSITSLPINSILRYVKRYYHVADYIHRANCHSGNICSVYLHVSVDGLFPYRGINYAY